MQHLDDDELILLALDEIPANQRAATHVDQCAQCGESLQSWRLTVGTARDADAELGPEPAPPHVWDAIAAELALLTQEVLTPLDHQAAHAASRNPPMNARGQQPVSLDSRRSRWVMPAMAAAIGAVISGLVVYFAVRDDVGPDTRDTKPQLEAVATLKPLLGGNESLGEAELVKSGNGVSWLQVQVKDLPVIEGSYEVWLLGVDGKMVSLGVLAAGEGNFALPQGIDTAAYSVVDISDEPADGNPAHSKNSVARGELA